MSIWDATKKAGMMGIFTVQTQETSISLHALCVERGPDRVSEPLGLSSGTHQSQDSNGSSDLAFGSPTRR